MKNHHEICLMKFILIAFSVLLTVLSCKDVHPVPAVEADIFIPDIETDPEFIDLNVLYNYVFLTGGYLDNGIIIVRQKFDGAYDDFIAFDRTCPYEVNSCRVLKDVDNSIYVKCECCNSKYEVASGYPIEGPSSYPLRQFKCSFYNGSLQIK